MSAEDSDQCGIIADNVEYLFDSFDSDEDANYGKFLKINKNIKPETSTQLPQSQKRFEYKPYEKTDCGPSTSQAAINEGEKTVRPLQESNAPDLAYQNNVILKCLLREVKCLRREVKELRNSRTTSLPSDNRVDLNLPRMTPESFRELEESVKCNKSYEEALANFFKTTNDPNFDKYVRSCLKSIISDKAACTFSWFGQFENVPVKSFVIMNILKECSLEKFPSCRSSDVINIIKRWFQYAKDRCRKSENRGQPSN